MDDQNPTCHGLLETRTGHMGLPGGGAIPPCKIYDLADAICRAEQARGGTIALKDLDIPAQDLCKRFARWHTVPMDGPLAALVTDEARRLVEAAE